MAEIKITIKAGGKKIDLTEKEWKEMFGKLKELFGTPTYIPVSVPWPQESLKPMYTVTSSADDVC